LNVETGTRLAAFEPAFHADDVDQVAEYRTVSVLAIISLLFGLASPLCLLSRLLLIIPLLGAVISVLALRRIAASGMLTGRGAAVTGLVLCIACGAATLSRDTVTRHLRTAQAEEFGRSWLRLVAAGDTDQAFRLTVDGARPPAPAEPGAPPPTTTPRDEFLKNELVKKISAAGPDAEIELLGTPQYAAYSSRHHVVNQRFLVSPKGSANGAESPEAIESELKLERARFAGERGTRWLVSGYAPNPATSK
jgi:hypothetical protein